LPHDRETAREMLAARGIRTNTRAGDLSRGEMQRTALVRVLMGRPAVILADEPTANLDEARGDIVVDDLMSAAQSLSASLILVSHSDRVLKRLPLTAEIRAGRFITPDELTPSRSIP
jgi:putative ABC transport system ATP-binding protein